MGASKTQLFTQEQNETAQVMKALAHPARIAIIELLMSKCSCICSDIVDELPLAQPTISQHLKELKQAGIIQGSIEGKSICYCLNPMQLQKINTYFKQLSQCCAQLGDEQITNKS